MVRLSDRITEDDPVHLIHYLENENCEVVFQREDKAASTGTL